MGRFFILYTQLLYKPSCHTHSSFIPTVYRCVKKILDIRKFDFICRCEKVATTAALKTLSTDPLKIDSAYISALVKALDSSKRNLTYICKCIIYSERRYNMVTSYLADQCNRAFLLCTPLGFTWI